MSDVIQFSVALVWSEFNEPHATFHHSQWPLVFDSLKDWRDYRQAVKRNIRAIDADVNAWAIAGTEAER